MSAVWSVRGVSPELRRAIVEAAEREGVSVAAWLEQRLSGNLGESPVDTVSAQEPASAEPGRAEPNRSLDGVLAAIDSCLASIVALETASLPQ